MVFTYGMHHSHLLLSFSQLGLGRLSLSLQSLFGEPSLSPALEHLEPKKNRSCHLSQLQITKSRLENRITVIVHLLLLNVAHACYYI